MNEEDRQTLRVLSLFLHYPAETMSDPGLSGLPPGPEKQVFETFWAYRRGTPLLRLQEEYTCIFDLNPSTCLNLTFHRVDANCRGKLLLSLREEYEDAGYENAPGELPDYLPLVLEFLTVCPDDACRRICGQYAAAVGLLASRLADSESPYAGLMRIAKGRFFEFSERRGRGGV